VEDVEVTLRGQSDTDPGHGEMALRVFDRAQGLPDIWQRSKTAV